GVDRLATTTTIRQAYYDLEMMFNSFRMRWPAHHELNTKLNSLFARVNCAYNTLSDLNKRRAYDMPSGKQSSLAEQIERGQPEPAQRSQAPKAAPNASQVINQPPAQPAAPQAKRPIETDLKKVGAEKYLQGQLF